MLGTCQYLSTILQCFDEGQSSEIAIARFFKDIIYLELPCFVQQDWILHQRSSLSALTTYLHSVPFMRRPQAKKKIIVLGLSVGGEHFALLRFTLWWWTIHLAIFCEADWLPKQPKVMNNTPDQRFNIWVRRSVLLQASFVAFFVFWENGSVRPCVVHCKLRL